MLYNDQYYERKLYEAKQKGNIAGFEEFIKNYPESKLIVKAQNSVYSLAWNDANIKNTIPIHKILIRITLTTIFSQFYTHEILAFCFQ